VTAGKTAVFQGCRGGAYQHRKISVEGGRRAGYLVMIERDLRPIQPTRTIPRSGGVSGGSENGKTQKAKGNDKKSWKYGYAKRGAFEQLHGFILALFPLFMVCKRPCSC
jgi:hypothetical protein